MEDAYFLAEEWKKWEVKPLLRGTGGQLRKPQETISPSPMTDHRGRLWAVSLRVGRTFPEVTLTYESDSSLGKAAYNSLSTLSSEM